MHLIPIHSLTVPAPWPVGRVTFHPAEDTDDLVGSELLTSKLANEVREIVAFHDGKGCIARAPDDCTYAESVNEVRRSLEVLRIYQATLTVDRTTQFGLGLETGWAAVPGLRVGARPAILGYGEGQATGWSFGQTELDRWMASAPFQFLSSSLAAAPDQGSRRAVLGARHLGRALVEPAADLKMLGLVSALEAWLLKSSQNAQASRLARRLAWLMCDLPQTNDRCGRERPACPAIALNPSNKLDRAALSGLRRNDTAWRCPTWHRVRDWYEIRNQVAHGDDPRDISPDDVDGAEFIIGHNFAPRILDWLAKHREDPVTKLDSAIADAPLYPDWDDIKTSLA